MSVNDNGTPANACSTAKKEQKLSNKSKSKKFGQSLRNGVHAATSHFSALSSFGTCYNWEHGFKSQRMVEQCPPI